MLTLPEELFLLAVHDERGLTPFSSRVNLGLAGAVFMELSLLKKIKTNASDEIVVIDSKPIGEDLLDKSLNDLVEAPMPVPATRWISKQSKLPLHFLWAEQLTAKKFLRKTSYLFLGFIPTQRYFLSNLEMKNSIVERLSEIMYEKSILDERSILLLSSKRKSGRLPFRYNSDCNHSFFYLTFS